MSSPRRSARALSGVQRDIEQFLDPSVLALAAREAGEDEPAAKARKVADELKATEPRLRLLNLRDEGEGLRADLEEARREAARERSQAEERASRDAAAIAKLTQRCEQLEQDARAKKRRVGEVEGRLLQVQGEKDANVRQHEELSERSRQAEESLQAEHADARKGLEEEVSRLREELSRSPAPGAGGGDGGASASEEVAALRARVAELESQASSLRLALETGNPDQALCAQLRDQHGRYEAELHALRGVRRELEVAQEQASRFEREASAARAALAARDAALQAAEEAARGASLSKRDLEAFAAVAATIIAEAAEPGAAPAAAGASTPLDLSLAWARLRAEGAESRRRCADLQQELDRASEGQRRARAELAQARTELAAAQCRAEEIQLELRQARNECATLTARTEVLREAISRSVGGDSAALASATGLGDAALKPQLDAALQRVASLETLAESSKRALEQAQEELQGLRASGERLAGAAAKAVQLERANAELWRSNRELEEQRLRLVAEIEQRDFDSSTTKILHLACGPGRAAPLPAAAPKPGGRAQDAQAENADLREELAQANASLQAAGAAAGDLHHQQAARQLERFRRATRKYVQDFREGIYSLLGWKVEMRGEGSAAQWHLSSRYGDGRELVFQLRAAEPGQPPAFDLLGTEWGEELQADRQAMAYLEVYSSIPGFLAHVATDLLAQSTLSG